ncbi:hypothetical protein [Microscilla marina]|uniref:Uncharacterized protein n=1 Tax=Microscilla marina ATCC 23134 TaxID=313606 RepID=A1ZJZ6_MICM2|nr:hypothetical protein [Microscilla marina]EAY29449.1 hypothetical protein M23134_01509 [Microscilla marina ATCC 23134]
MIFYKQQKKLSNLDDVVTYILENQHRIHGATPPEKTAMEILSRLFNLKPSSVYAALSRQKKSIKNLDEVIDFIRENKRRIV